MQHAFFHTVHTVHTKRLSGVFVVLMGFVVHTERLNQTDTTFLTGNMLNFGKASEKAHLDNYIDNRDAELKGLGRYSDGGFERRSNELQATFLEKVEELGHSKRYCNALTSDVCDA